MGNPMTGATPSLASAMSKMALEDEAPRSPPEWPRFPEPDDEDNYGAAMRAADALFSRPAPEPEPQDGDAPQPAAAASNEPPRRILESLNEDDHIERLLAAQAEDRPKRGRRPRDPQDEAAMPAPRRIETPVGDREMPELILADMTANPEGLIPGFVRGEIFARYARHTQARPGEQWRKRGIKPNW
ncbi:MAG: hypothetical protein JWN07_3606 [Hyphomicrobiales bacterium]|nr:hypothetical protein [Hyphomicrobiales bacterium]